uniref:Uncharacterized protein n=1 Tax=Rhizophora mucronata TaxID=61149 RepID=A0A2P2IWH4_RHIMU
MHVFHLDVTSLDEENQIDMCSDPVRIQENLIIRAKTKKVQEVLNGLIEVIWAKRIKTWKNIKT